MLNTTNTIAALCDEDSCGAGTFCGHQLDLQYPRCERCALCSSFLGLLPQGYASCEASCKGSSSTLSDASGASTSDAIVFRDGGEGPQGSSGPLVLLQVGTARRRVLNVNIGVPRPMVAGRAQWRSPAKADFFPPPLPGEGEQEWHHDPPVPADAGAVSEEAAPVFLHLFGGSTSAAGIIVFAFILICYCLCFSSSAIEPNLVAEDSLHNKDLWL